MSNHYEMMYLYNDSSFIHYSIYSKNKIDININTIKPWGKGKWNIYNDIITLSYTNMDYREKWEITTETQDKTANPYYRKLHIKNEEIWLRKEQSN